MFTLRKKITVVAIAAVFALGISALVAMAGDEHKKADEHKMSDHKMSGDMMSGKEVTMVGEVLDLYCYMNHPETAQGMDHMKCAKSCINKGLPIGFKASDGKVYVLLGKDHQPVATMVADYAGIQSRLKGTVMSHDGIMGIEVASIEKVDSK